MKNILTIDFEDWYQDLNFNCWNSFEDRLFQNTTRLLSILNKKKSTATFFILGYNALRFPSIIETIIENGHEIAVHGYNHLDLTNQQPSEFEQDLTETLHILKNICKEKIECFRAPYFSLTQNTSWILDILKNHDIKYDSSIFPVKTPLYGVPDAPQFPYYICSNNITRKSDSKEIFEFPISTIKLSCFNRNIPIGGGFFLRFFPYKFIKIAIQLIHKQQQPAIFYFHPWELDHLQPKISSYKWWKYYNLNNSEKKFKKLLDDFDFISIRDYLEVKNNNLL
ncbi:MAG: polysaccharide deacetylase family protein [Promethearchaeota archaeon]